MGRKAQTLESLLSKTTTTEDGHMLFTGCKDKDGYGVTSIKHVKMPAHRAAWLLSGEVISEGLYVLHRCNVRNCINPNHLYIGTQKENVKDQFDADTFVRGEKNGSAKLTELQVREIRTNRNSARYYADLYNVSYYTIWDILSGRSWQHVK